MSESWNYNKKVGLTKDNSLGNTNTPPEVALSLVEKFIDLDSITKETTFLEPCVGTGSFYFALVQHLSKKFSVEHILKNMIFAYEIDENAINILKNEIKKRYNVSLTKTNIKQGNFLLMKINQKFDFVLTNPPYISSTKIKPTEEMTREEYISKLRETINSKMDKKSDIYLYFFVKTLNLLKENGKQIFLCSDSWLDSNFGQVLKEMISDQFNLDFLISHRLYSLFRDDTSAITTVISKSKNLETKVYQLDSKDFSFDMEKDLSFCLKKEIFIKKVNDSKINKRNLFVLFGKEYLIGEQFLKNNKNILTKLKEIVEIESSSTTFNDLKKMDILEENKLNQNKVFFQIQARINKPPNYKNNIKKEELIYSIDSKKAKDLVELKSNNVYLSTIIDRYPLLFYVKEAETYHVSKYLSLKFKDKEIPIELLPIAINNLISMYMIEIFLKEGTRKTLRIGEMGFGKEIRKSEFQNISILDVSKISNEAKSEIILLQNNLENVVLYNIEEACKNEDYLKIQSIIIRDLKLEVDLIDLKNKVLGLYFRRMRNIKKITE